jgi:hypothetical protein
MLQPALLATRTTVLEPAGSSQPACSLSFQDIVVLLSFLSGMHRVVKFLLLVLALFSCLFLIAHLITAFDHRAHRDRQSSALQLHAPADSQQQRINTATSPSATRLEDVQLAPLPSHAAGEKLVLHPSAAAAESNATAAVATPALPSLSEAEQGSTVDVSHQQPSTSAEVTTTARNAEQADRLQATAAASPAAAASTAPAVVSARPPAAASEAAGIASAATGVTEHPSYAAEQQQQQAHVDHTQPTHPHHAAPSHAAHVHDWPLPSLHHLHHDAQLPQYVTMDALDSAASHHYAAFAPSLQQFAYTGGLQAAYCHSAAATACGADDFWCQLQSICQPCFSGLHTALCSPCAALLHCQHESCTHRTTCQLCQHVTEDSRPPVCRQLC